MLTHSIRLPRAVDDGHEHSGSPLLRQILQALAPRREPPPRDVQIVASFATPDDWRKVAPRSRPIARDAAAVRVGRELLVHDALLGAALALAVLLGVALVAGPDRLARLARVEVAVAALLGAGTGAAAGIARALATGRAVGRELEAQRARGHVESVLGASEDEAQDVAHDLESRGALEALVLPRGLTVEAPPDGVRTLEAHPDPLGATLLAGPALLAAAFPGAGRDLLRVAAFARSAEASPASSGLAGVGRGHGRPAPAEAWWRTFEPVPRRLALADGDLLVAGPAASSVLEALAGHADDTISSALARLARVCECPDASAWVFADAVDDGSVGFLLLGKRSARRRAVEKLSFAATASSEGAAALDEAPPLRRAA